LSVDHVNMTALTFGLGRQALSLSNTGWIRPYQSRFAHWSHWA